MANNLFCNDPTVRVSATGLVSRYAAQSDSMTGLGATDDKQTP